MIRPCFLVIDREFPGSISTRKLVIETAKFNVLSVYSGPEAIETLERFPRLHGAVLDGGLQKMTCDEVAARLKQMQPDLPIIVIAAPGFEGCPHADYILESFDPRKLLELLRTLRPEDAAEIEARNEKLSREHLSPDA